MRTRCSGKEGSAVGDAMNNTTAAGNASVAAMQARMRGKLARQAAYQEAYDLEGAAAAQGYIAGDNMMTMRQNEVAALGAARADAGASGFAASSGSKAQVEQSVAEQFEVAIANMQKSNAISDQNSRYAANVRRSEGEQQMRVAEVEAQYYDKVARQNRHAFMPNLIGGTLLEGAKFGMSFASMQPGGKQPQSGEQGGK